MKKKFITILMVLVLVLGLTACGGDTSAEPTKAPEATATTAPTKAPDPTATTAPTKAPDPTATPVPTETPVPTQTPVVEEPTPSEDEIDISNWACYAGTMGEEYVYYAFNEDGTRGGLMFLSADLTKSISVFGECGVDEQTGIAYIIDDTTNLLVGFGVTENADGTYTIDFGNLGTAVVGAAEPQVVLDAMDTIMAGTTDVTAEFIASLEAEEQGTSNVVDITGWNFFAGFVEQQGDFYDTTIVFTHDATASKAGIMFVKAGGTGEGGFLFGDYLYDEATGLSYIYDSVSDLAAVFSMSLIADGIYTVDFGGLGYVTMVSQPENVGYDVYSLASTATVDVTEAFLLELARITEAGEEDPELSYYFSGTMDTGDTVYYSRTMGGTNNALVILDPAQEKAVMAQGATTFDEVTQTEVITDIMTGYQVYYQVQKVSGGYQLIFAGGQLGTVTLTKCTDYEFFDAMDYAFINPENITGAFVDALNSY